MTASVRIHVSTSFISGGPALVHPCNFRSCSFLFSRLDCRVKTYSMLFLQRLTNAQRTPTTAKRANNTVVTSHHSLRATRALSVAVTTVLRFSLRPVRTATAWWWRTARTWTKTRETRGSPTRAVSVRTVVLVYHSHNAYKLTFCQR